MRHLIAPSLTFFALALGLLLGHARAQTPDKSKTQTKGRPQSVIVNGVYPSDVDSIDHIIAAVYDVISGPAGQKREWDRMRSLFVPGARLMPPSPVRPRGAAPDSPLNGNEPLSTRVLTVEDYIRSEEHTSELQSPYVISYA